MFRFFRREVLALPISRRVAAGRPHEGLILAIRDRVFSDAIRGQVHLVRRFFVIAFVRTHQEFPCGNIYHRRLEVARGRSRAFLDGRFNNGRGGRFGAGGQGKVRINLLQRQVGKVCLGQSARVHGKDAFQRVNLVALLEEIAQRGRRFEVCLLLFYFNGFAPAAIHHGGFALLLRVLLCAEVLLQVAQMAA